jgi:DNA-binding transcriptional ArsR family regulator/predicted RNA-binding Zn-ribbon protein involved in translation (DUF1610 family)
MKSAGYPANFEVRGAGCNIYHPIETVKVHDNGYYCRQCYRQLLHGQPVAKSAEEQISASTFPGANRAEGTFFCSACDKELTPGDIRVQAGETFYCARCYEKASGMPANRAISDFYRSMAPSRRGPTMLRSADPVIECKDCGMVITRDRLVEDESGKFCCPKCGTDLGVRPVRSETPGKEDLAGTAQMFRRLGDPCRVKIIESLSEGELNVSAFVEIIGAQYSLTSYHLKVLKELGLVRSCKQGNFVNYSLTDNGKADHEFIKKYNLPDQG